MRAIIMCAGDGKRWGNYLGVQKHLLAIDDESLVVRTVRLLNQNRIDDIWITSTSESALDVSGAKLIHVASGGSELDRFANGFPAWDTDKELVYLYGDVFYSTEAMKVIVETVNADFRAFGRPGPSALTGKQYGELFALRFTDKILARAALDSLRIKVMKRRLQSFDRSDPRRGADDTRMSGWSFYRQIEGFPLREQRIGPRFVTIDDWTEDFDFPVDYDRWMELKREVNV